MKTGQAHILVYKHRRSDKEDKEMCDRIKTEEQGLSAGSEQQGDVDDLIFRDEREWLASDR